MKEQQPKTEVNSFLEFQSFFDAYVSGILTNPPNKKPFPKNLLPDPANTALYPTEDNPFHDEIIRHRLKGVIVINGIPWGSIPESLQRLLSIQYDSASKNEDKKINAMLGNNRMMFFLESNHSHDSIDWEGEYHSSGLTLMIHRTDLDDELDRIGGEKINEGDFAFQKTVLSTQIRSNSLLQFNTDRDLADEDKTFLERTMHDKSWRNIQLIPSKLVDLQDIVKLLMGQKQNAFIYSD